MNLIVSGWPASGGSTLAMLAAAMLGYKYLYAGGLFKFLAGKLYGSEDGDAQMQFERELGTEWDEIWEAYALCKMQTAEKVLLEGKTSGFLIDGAHIFKVMVVADIDTRAKRAAGENRQNAREIILARDEEVGGRWKQNLNVDIYDRNYIGRIYDTTIDTSEMTVREELEVLVDALRRSQKFEGVEFVDLLNQIESLEELFSKQGKLGLMQLLTSKQLQVTPQEILREWNQTMPKEVEKLSPKFRELVKTYA